MGFNNDGYDAARARLAARPARGIVGVNIGPNRDAADRIADIVARGEDLRALRRLFRAQRLLAQHARPARPAAARRVRRIGGPRRRGARAGGAASAAAGQDRARPRSARRSTTSSKCARARGVDGHHRRQHDDRATGVASRPRPWRGGRPLRSAAVRTLDANAGARLSALRRRAGADRLRRRRDAPRRRWPRSRRARRWSRSTPASSIAARR